MKRWLFLVGFFAMRSQFFASQDVAPVEKMKSNSFSEDKLLISLQHQPNKSIEIPFDLIHYVGYMDGKFGYSEDIKSHRGQPISSKTFDKILKNFENLYFQDEAGRMVKSVMNMFPETIKKRHDFMRSRWTKKAPQKN